MDPQFDNEERLHKVPSFFLPYEGKSILELGDGLGCFTGELAKKASKVISIDSYENVVKKSKSVNGHCENVEFMCADDVNSPDLNFPAESFDLIFSNWISTMRLSDVEIKDIATKLLKWMNVGGYIMFRDPRFHQAGDDKQNNNTQDVHGPRFYTKVFKECHLSDASGNSFEFSLVGSKCFGAYDLDKKNHNQIWWVWKKVNSKDDTGPQKFLDDVQYKSSEIQRYERLFGLGFVSVGGLDTTKEFVGMLDLKAGQKVLDVGCGSGGNSFYMADNFDVDVIGIDLSVNMISLDLERAIEHKCSVEFEVADCTKKSFPNDTFDVIYSRDVIIHIQDKFALFQTFYKWLKPGGKVLITDFCFSRKTITPSAAEFIKQLGHNMPDSEAYCEMLTDAGFREVTAEDRTLQSKKEFMKHLEIIEKEKEEILGDFSEEEYNDYVTTWKDNMIRIDSGDQKWVMFLANKK